MTYTELVAAVKSYADRNDSEVNASFDSFILMAEAKINRLLRVNEMSTRATVATLDDKEYYALPSDFAGMRDVEMQVGNERYTLEYRTPEQMNTFYGENYTNNYIIDCNPEEYYYTIIAQNIHILPIQGTGSTVEIVYYQKLEHLDGDTTTSNWMSEDYPDIYLAALMVEVASFVKNAQAVQIWEGRFDKAINALNNADQKDRWSGTPLRMRVQ